MVVEEEGAAHTRVLWVLKRVFLPISVQDVCVHSSSAHVFSAI